MKVVHVPFNYYPDPIGGTEIFVQSLAKHLARSGVESVIAAPGQSDSTYFHSGLKVRRFAGQSAGWPVEYPYGEGDRIAAAAFDEILAAELPDLVHIHALTSMVSPFLASRARARGLPIVFTYHAANTSCQTGTLLRWGRERCDGRMEASRCASCNLVKLGLPRQVASVVGRVPASIARMIETAGLRGRAWTALRLNELTARRHAHVRDFLAMADAIVAPANWVADLLLANGVPRAKVTICGQGEPHGRVFGIRRARKVAGGPLRIAVLSRLDATKGVHVLVEALAAHRGLDVTLDIFGVAQPNDSAYEERLARSIEDDRRITLHRAIPNDEVVATLARFDVLAVPSQVMETGPLVVLEAFAAGIPVVGSDLGGVAERVAHERTGLLVPHADRNSWAMAFARLRKEPLLLRRLARAVMPPPQVSMVAAKMDRLYRRLVSRADDARRHRATASA